MHAKPAEDVAPSGSCEFVGDPIYKGSSGRKCGVDGIFCPARIYSNSKVFGSCSTRLEKLKSKGQT